MSELPWMPIDSKEKEIRLIFIEKGQLSEGLQCHFGTAKLADQPVYKALSYHWGPKRAPRPVCGDGISVEIPSNLHEAMRHSRRPDEGIWMWIDALCINQNDIDERNQQVAFMGEVYRNAEEVIVWLEEADAKTDLAMGTIHALGNDSSLHWDGRPQDSVPADFFRPENLTAVSDLLDKPWWTRVWTLQEAVLAKTLTFLCGPHRLSFEGLVNVSENFFRHNHGCCDLKHLSKIAHVVLKFSMQMGSIRSMKDLRATKDTGTFWSRMLDHRERTSSEPKDQVYGFLGIGDRSSSSIIQPDYSVSDASVYEEVAFKILENTKDLTILHHVLPEQSLPGHPSLNDLPSWVPNWTIQVPHVFARETLRMRIDRCTQYLASGDRTGRYNYSESGSLVLRGIIFGKIGQLGHPRKDGKLFWDPEFDVPIIENWRQLAEVDTNPDRPYHSAKRQQDDHQEYAESMYDAFWQTLCSSLAIENPEDGDLKDKKFARITDKATARSNHESSWQYIQNWRTNSSLERRTNLCLYSVMMSIASRRFFISADEHQWIGLAPWTAQEGDQLVVFEGAPVPFVIRPHEDASRQEWTFVGSAYVHGAMDGEVLELGETQDITLI